MLSQTICLTRTANSVPSEYPSSLPHHHTLNLKTHNMKMTLLPRTKCILLLSLTLAAISLVWCHRAFAQSRRAETQYPDNVVPVFDQNSAYRPSAANENGPENEEVRREYLNRLLGTYPPGMSPAAYAEALAAARAVPPSPLLRGGDFVPARPGGPPGPDAPTPPWTFPALHPISTPPPVTACSAWIHALAAHPTDSNTVYAGGWGGLAKSSNGGTNWQYLSDTWATQEISSIAIDPVQPGHIYVGTGKNYGPAGFGLHRSFNGGAGWGVLGTAEFQGTIMNTVAIDARTAGSTSFTNIWVANSIGANAGLWRSTTSGLTWVRMRQGPYPPNGIYDIAIDPATNPSTLYISQDGGVFMSTDGGASWGNAIFSTPGQLRVVNSVLYLLAAGGNPSANRLYKRVNQTWTEIPTQCPPNAYWCTQGQPINPGVFAVDPNNSSVILVGNVILFRTADANSPNPTWTHLGFNNMHVDQRALAFSPALNGLAYSGNDGGVWKSLSSGASDTWVNLNQNLPGILPYSVGLSRDDTIIVGTQDNGAVFSPRLGQWDNLWMGDGGHSMMDPNPASGNTLYFTIGWNAQSYWIRIENPRVGGPTEIWADVRPPPLNAELNAGLCSYVPAFSMNPSIPQNLVAACQTVVQSTDRGNPSSWRAIGAPIGGGTQSRAVSHVYEAPSNSSIIYAAAPRVSPAPSDGVFVTTNAASPAPTWTDITGSPGFGGLPAGTQVGALIVHPTNPQTVYVAGNTGIYKSTTMGPPWVSLTAPTAVYTGLALDPTYPTHIFAATRMVGVYHTTINENTWASINGMPLGMFVSGLSFNGTSRQLAASTYGRGIYMLDLDDIPPTVVITTPANGATVGGIVTVAATATDNHRVAGVQFKLNGFNLQAEDTTFPYSIAWSTWGLTGNHTLTAVARDASGNLGTSLGVTVTVKQSE